MGFCLISGRKSLALAYFLLLYVICRAHESAHGMGDGDETFPQLESRWNSTTAENRLIAAVTVETHNTFGLTNFEAEKVFGDGEMLGPWKGCGEESVPLSKCKSFASYVDRVSFTYTHDKDRIHEYTFSEPTVTSSNSASSPQVEDFDFDGGIFTFTVLFQCENIGFKQNSTELLEVTIPILDNFGILLRFTKVCATGVHPYAELGVVNGLDRHIVSTHSGNVVVAPTVVTTGLFVHLSSPAVSLVHGKPSIASTDRSIVASLRGIKDFGTMVVGNDFAFSIVYECNVNGAANISLSLPIPPWDDMSVTFTKKCGGLVPTMIDMGTDPGSTNVLKEGEARPEFMMLNAIGSEADNEGYVVGRNMSHMDLFIWNRDGYEKPAVHFGKALFTSSQPKTVIVKTKPSSSGSNELLAPGKSRVLSMEFICRREGAATIIVSIPVLQYKVIEFCFKKECKQPESYRDFGWQSLWTVEGLEDTVLVLAGLALLACCIRMRGRGGRIMEVLQSKQSYDEVATEEHGEK